MTTLRTLVILARSLVMLTIAIAGAAVIDSLLAEAWHDMVTRSQTVRITR